MAVTIGTVLQHARTFDLKYQGEPVDLNTAAAALFRELKQSRGSFRRVGGMTTLSYIEGRNTQRRLAGGDNRRAATSICHANPGRRVRPGSFRVDLLLGSNRLFA
jgi:hypothetical protein